MLNILIILFFSIITLGQELTESQKQYIKSENILKNPGGENGRTDWVLTAGTLASESTVVVSGKRSLRITLSSQSFDLRQDSTLYQAQFADGVQGLASVRVKTTVSGIRVCSRQNGVVSSSLCVNVQANGKWGLYKVPFTLGGTSNGIEIDSNSVAVTGDVYVDDAFVGAVDLAADVQSVQKGSLSYAKTTNCAFATASTSYASFTADTDCPAASVTGIVSAPATKVPGFVLPAGTQGRVFVVGSIYSQPTTSGSAMFGRLRLTDGTNNYGDNFSAYSAGAGAGNYTATNTQTFEFSISNPLPTATTYQLQGLTTNAANAVNVNGADYNIEFYVTVYPSNAGTSTYSSTNADTDWQSCNYSSLAFNGLGNVTSGLICKRSGSDLLMKGRLTVGVPTASEARINLPLWNGVQLTTSGTQKIPLIEIVGFAHRNALTTTQYGILAEPSVGYLTIDAQSGGTAGLAKQNGSTLFGTGDIISFTARIPIEGWENSNIIIGQFNGLESCTDSFECEDIYSARVSATGIITEETPGDWINGSASQATGAFTVPFVSGRFTVTPQCWAEIEVNTTGWMAEAHTTSTSQVLVKTSQGVSASSGAFTLYCRKQGVDYIGKTAKAVASDQNVRVSGVLKAVSMSASVSATCSSSPCTLANSYGSNITNLTRSSLGTYSLNFNNLSATPVCTITPAATTPPNAPVNCARTSVTSSAFNYTCMQGGALLDWHFEIICNGTSL